MEEIAALECEYVGGAGPQPKHTWVLPVFIGASQVRSLSPSMDAIDCHIFNLKQ